MKTTTFNPLNLIEDLNPINLITTNLTHILIAVMVIGFAVNITLQVYKKWVNGAAASAPVPTPCVKSNNSKSILLWPFISDWLEKLDFLVKNSENLSDLAHYAFTNLILLLVILYCLFNLGYIYVGQKLLSNLLEDSYIKNMARLYNKYLLFNRYLYISVAILAYANLLILAYLHYTC